MRAEQSLKNFVRRAVRVELPSVSECVRTVSSLRDSGSLSHFTKRCKRWATLFRAYGAAFCREAIARFHQLERLHSLLKNSDSVALYQGTTSVVPISAFVPVPSRLQPAAHRRAGPFQQTVKSCPESIPANRAFFQLGNSNIPCPRASMVNLICGSSRLPPVRPLALPSFRRCRFSSRAPQRPMPDSCRQ